MQANTGRGDLQDPLSDRILRVLPASTWREALLELGRRPLELRHASATMLCAQVEMPGAALAASLRAEIAYVASRFGARVDHCPTATALLAFDDPCAALDAALEINQLANWTRCQIGLARGGIVQAAVHVAGRDLDVRLGDAVERATAACLAAPAATIRLGPELLGHLAARIAAVPRYLVTTEYLDDGLEIDCISLAPAPGATEALSTFAGLGPA